MKQKNSLTAFAVTLLMAIIIGTLISCSDNDNGQENPEPQDYSVQVEITYTPTGNPEYIDSVELTWPQNDEGEESKSVVCDETWTKQLTYTQLPATVGFIATPAIKNDLQPGTEVTIGYNVKCHIYLKRGDKVVDSEIFEDNSEYTIDADNLDQIKPEDWVQGYLYEVTEKGIKPIAYSDMLKDDVEEVISLPTHDNDSIKAQGTLYYFSRADEEEDEESLSDNFIARFSNRIKWDGLPLNKGDFLFLFKSDIEKANRDAVRESLSNGAIIVVAYLDSYATFKGFCDAMELYNPIAEETLDVSHSMFIVADAKTSLSPENAVPVSNIFFMLSPKSSDNGFMSDYGQGTIIDRAVTKINEIFTPTTSTQALMSRANDNSALEQIANTYKVWLQSDSCKQTLPQKMYRKEKVADDEQTNIYEVEYDICNVFSLNEKRNYYHIHQELSFSFHDCYKGVYNANVTTNKIWKTIAKVCEWYGDEVEVSTIPKTPGMQMHRNAPATTQSSTTYSSGVSWNLNGQVGWLGSDFTGNVGSNVSFNSSSSYTIEDITVANRCIPREKLAWNFMLAPASVDYKFENTSQTKITPGALAGRETFTAGTDFIISFPESEGQPILAGLLRVQLRSTCGKAGLKCAERTAVINRGEMPFKLPYLKSTDFNNQ